MSKPIMTMSIPAVELEKFRRWVELQKVEIRKEGKTIIHGVMGEIERKAKMNAPVDKGFLRSSIHQYVNKDGLGGMVYTGRHYAPYMEWGTGSKVKVPSFVKEMFGVDSMEWKGRGIRKVNIPPHPYLFHAARIGYIDMINRLKKLGFTEKSGNVNKGVIISNMMY
jgi:hypothetical protein